MAGYQDWAAAGKPGGSSGGGTLPGPLPRKYGTTNVHALIDLIGARLADTGGPQGTYAPRTKAQQDAASRYYGYAGSTELRQGITGLAQYEKSREDALAELLSQAADVYAQHARGASQQATRSLSDVTKASHQFDTVPGDAEAARQAASYAGQSAQLYARQHPDEAVRYGPSGYGAQGGAAQTAAAQLASLAPRLAQARTAQAQVAEADTANRAAFGAARTAEAQQKDYRDAMNEMLYGSLTPYQQQAAVEIGVDPLQAAGMFYDTPADQLSTFRQGRDLQSLAEHGLPYGEYQTSQEAAAKQAEQDRQAALDAALSRATGISASALQSRSGLDERTLTELVSQPAYQDLAQAQDQAISALLDDNDPGPLQDLFRGLPPDVSRLLRARMSGLGISDADWQG